MDENNSVTVLLQQWRHGDEAALERLTPLIYQQLRRIAARYLRDEPAGHTWQATELVHESYLQLAGADVDWQNRAHFIAVAARQMRRLLVDHARNKRRVKRGGGALPVTFEEGLLPAQSPDEDLLDLDNALERLNQHDPRKAAILELHVFGGMSYDEIAAALDLSPATVNRDLRFARAWVFKAVEAVRTGGDQG